MQIWLSHDLWSYITCTLLTPGQIHNLTIGVQSPCHNLRIPICRGEAGDTRYASQSLIPKSPASPLQRNQPPILSWQINHADLVIS